MMQSRILPYTVLVLFALALIGCASGAQVRDVSDAALDRTHDMDDVRTAIIRAGANRGWRMQPQDDGHIVGTLEVREHMAQVDIRYTRDSFDITYRDSENLNYDPETGTIHKNYNSWIRNLETDIHNNLAAM